jgi:hypothetical protein
VLGEPALRAEPPNLHQICRFYEFCNYLKDIVVVTESGVAACRNNPPLIIKPAMDEGKVLYAAG